MTRCIIRSFTAFGFRQAQDDRWKKCASEIYGRHRDCFGGNKHRPTVLIFCWWRMDLIGGGLRTTTGRPYGIDAFVRCGRIWNPPLRFDNIWCIGQVWESVAEILYAKVLTILQFACKIKQKWNIARTCIKMRRLWLSRIRVVNGYSLCCEMAFA